MKLAVTLSSQIYRLGALHTSLRAAAMLVALYARAPLADRAGRECLAQARLCGRLTRQLIARSVHNQRVAIKRAMQGSAARRAQVLRDLGGEAGLARWEASLERARKREVFRRAQARYQGQNPDAQINATRDAQRERQRRRQSERHSDQALRKSMVLERQRRAGFQKIERYPNMVYDPCRLDRSGVFRLAAITRGPRGSAAAQHGGARTTGVLRRDRRRREGKLRRLSGLRAPIPLVPDDLRLRVRGGAERAAPLRAAALPPARFMMGGRAAGRPPIGKPP